MQCNQAGAYSAKSIHSFAEDMQLQLSRKTQIRCEVPVFCASPSTCSPVHTFFTPNQIKLGHLFTRCNVP